VHSILSQVGASYALEVTQRGLELVLLPARKSRLFCDFVSGPLGYRRIKGGGRNQAIARAVGLKTYKLPLTILDATAGLGRDAFVLASLGCKMCLVERSPILAALLQDGLERALQSPEVAPIIRSMQFILQDAHFILAGLTSETAPDVVYLDPMFPTKEKKSKSALTKMEMRIIRDMVGEDFDAALLLPLALAKARKRVVVKRPKVAPPLVPEPAPSFVVPGKSNRYDVYLTGGDITGV